MWGWAVLHSADSTNRLEPSRPVPGYEGMSRVGVVDSSMTPEKEMRNHRPFLSLAFKTIPKALRGADFNPRAEPCVSLIYDRSKKAWALLTIPGLSLTYSVEVRFVPMAFPLRATDHLSSQIYNFLRPRPRTTSTRVFTGQSMLSGAGSLPRRQPRPVLSFGVPPRW